MRRIMRWCAKHRLLAKVLLIVLICGAYTWMISDIDAPRWAFVVLNGTLIFIINTISIHLYDLHYKYTKNKLKKSIKYI